MGKLKAIDISGPAVSKGYKVSAVNASVPSASTGNGSVQAKEFIMQSRTLDNEQKKKSIFAIKPVKEQFKRH